MFFECEQWADCRQLKWDKVTAIMPDGMIDMVNNTSATDTVKFVLSELN